MFQNIPKDKVLDVVKLGPTIPIKVAKAVGGDTMIIGAILSTLISTGDVRVSTLKIGGSPLYYIPEHEVKLEDFINYLNEKDQKTFHILKDSKVLIDSEQDPLIRVSLRTIKDFAKSFEVESVDSSGKKILFWRYYLVPRDEAIGIAKNMMKKAPVVEPEKKKEADVIIEKASEHEEENTGHVKKHIAPKEHAVDEESNSSKTDLKVDFFELVKKHIVSKNLDIISKEKIKKSEYDFILKNHDTNEYIYCKTKDKKSINEGDLASAFVFAQSKKMPCIFITTGSLTKKAESMIHKEFSGMTIEKITL